MYNIVTDIHIVRNARSLRGETEGWGLRTREGSVPGDTPSSTCDLGAMPLALLEKRAAFRLHAGRSLGLRGAGPVGPRGPDSPWGGRAWPGVQLEPHPPQ